MWSLFPMDWRIREATRTKKTRTALLPVVTGVVGGGRERRERENREKRENRDRYIIPPRARERHRDTNTLKRTRTR